MSQHRDFSHLVKGYIAQSLSPQEKEDLLKALNEPANIPELSLLFAAAFRQAREEGSFVYDAEKVEKMIRHITADAAVTMENNPDMRPPLYKRRLMVSWMGYAAAAVILLGAGLFYYRVIHNQSANAKGQMPPAIVSQNDVLPGTNKAVLTLSNGKTITLTANGIQVIQDGAAAIQNNNGALEYGKSDLIASNTMTTPRGGQYKLKLADGTLVWLNASSSITYPLSFPGKERVVNITGEVYFEVAKNAAQPFIVKTYGDQIIVKGTSFNVNSYTDEAGIKTSLLEGLVEINNTLLHPGFSYTNGAIAPADMGKELAWKNGVFNFHHVKLREAMRQIARWYDVEIRYDEQAGNIELGGEIGRNLSLQQLLNGLEDKDIHFRLEEGRVLTVF